MLVGAEKAITLSSWTSFKVPNFDLKQFSYAFPNLRTQFL